jgi:hypothetical protein
MGTEQQPVLAVDCDGTVIYKRELNSMSDANALPGVRIFERDRVHFQVVARPSARPFLEHFAKLKVPMIVLTGGAGKIQRLAIKIADLDDFFDGVYCPGDVFTAAMPIRWVLVDDAFPESSSLRDKFAQMRPNLRAPSDAEVRAMVENNFVHCHKFEGKGDEMMPLTALIDEVSRKLGV